MNRFRDWVNQNVYVAAMLDIYRRRGLTMDGRYLRSATWYAEQEAQRLEDDETVRRATGGGQVVIERDAGGRGALTNPMEVIAARQKTLGPEATIADAGGQNTRQLLDTLATLPGKTKDVTENLIHSRQAGRADRLIDAAESGLGTNGARLPQTLEALDAARKDGNTHLGDDWQALATGATVRPGACMLAIATAR